MASTAPILASTTIDLPSGRSLSVSYHLPAQPVPTSPTVLCLPFWGGSAGTFAAVLQSLGFKLPSINSVGVSYPGTGSSSPDREDADPEKHSVPALASDLLEALRSQQLQDLIPSGKVIIVAHSMSAKIAYELVPGILEPSTLLNLKIASLFLLAPAPPTPLVLPENMRKQQLTAYSTFDSARWTMANILTRKPLPEKILDSLAADAANQSEGAKRGWIEVGMGHDCTAALRGLSARGNEIPFMVLVGSEDQVETVERVRKETVQPCSAAGLKISMRVVEGVGHLLPVEAVDEVVDVIQELLTV